MYLKSFPRSFTALRAGLDPASRDHNPSLQCDRSRWQSYRVRLPHNHTSAQYDLLQTTETTRRLHERNVLTQLSTVLYLAAALLVYSSYKTDQATSPRRTRPSNRSTTGSLNNAGSLLALTASVLHQTGFQPILTGI